MEKILILTDHHGYVFTSLKGAAGNSADSKKVKSYLLEKGYEAHIASLHQIPEEWKQEGIYVFYPSSEVSGLFYKEYIEDVLLDLKLRGLKLLPEFPYFRAHHNKVFMEMMRSALSQRHLKTIHSYSIYDSGDLKKMLPLLEKELKYPMVLKMSSGSGASGVVLVKDRLELILKARKMTSIVYRNYSTFWHSSTTLSCWKRRMKKAMGKPDVPLTYPQEKIVIQNFIPNLKYDFKVLVFGEKYYILKRLTRDNDFRASGSGKLFFPKKLDDEIRLVLDTSEELFGELNVPMLSADVAFDGERCHVIEFQCVSFGPYTLQFSDRHYVRSDGMWCTRMGESILESEIANALDRYIRQK